MKTLGNTFDGKFIVEMSREEHISLINLENTFMNTQPDIFASNREFAGKDLSPVFEALYKLSNTKSSIRQIKEYISLLDSAFGGTEE